MARTPYEALPKEEIDFDVTIEMEDGSEVDFKVFRIYPVGEVMYAALIPARFTDDEELDVLIYRYEEDKNGNSDLIYIEDDEEADIASEAFDELMDSEEYEDLYADEDE